MEENNGIKLKTILKNEENIKNILKRLNRVNGQINGVKKMIESGRFCGDIMIQISACEKALVAISDFILKEHLDTCFVEGHKKDKDDMIAESLYLIKTMR